MMYLEKRTLIAIIRGVNRAHITEVVRPLMEEGIYHVEISLSELEEALSCIETLKKAYGTKIILGVGTVCNSYQLSRAIDAGAEYVITPAWDKELSQECIRRNIAIFPGVFSPSEIMQALQLGLKQLKLFPAGSLGPSYIKNLLGPFPTAQFIGVGDINLSNIRTFVEAGCHAFGLGSSLVPRCSEESATELIRINARKFLNAISVCDKT